MVVNNLKCFFCGWWVKLKWRRSRYKNASCSTVYNLFRNQICFNSYYEYWCSCSRWLLSETNWFPAKFVGLQGVLKMSTGYVLKMPSRSFQRNNFLSSIRFKNVWEKEELLSWGRLQLRWFTDWDCFDISTSLIDVDILRHVYTINMYMIRYSYEYLTSF